MDDQYQPVIPVPGVRVAGWVRDAWGRAIGSWRPDERTVGVLLVAWFIGGLIDRLLIADYTWSGFVDAVGGSSLFHGVPAAIGVQAVTRLLGIPAEFLAVLGGIGLALRHGWGRAAAVAGLGLLLAGDIVAAAASVTAASSVNERPAIAGLISAVAGALPLAVLVWSRRPEADQ